MQKRKEFIINTVYFLIIFALVYFGVNYLLGMFAPFLLAFLFAYAARKLTKKFFKEDKKLYRCLMLIAIYALIILLFGLLISLGINKLGDFINTLPNFYRTTLEPYITSLEKQTVSLGESFPQEINESLNAVIDSIFESLKTILSSLLTGIVNLTTTILARSPQALVSLIVMFVSSFYIVNDYEYIASSLKRFLPDKYQAIFYEIRDFFENVLLKILGSYLSIMALTFVELFIGLSIIGITNSGMWALIISFLDILPVLGVGTILIPWGISLLIAGKFATGICILILYIVIAIVRNFVEPRLVGTNLGLHPLAALISMIVGVSLFGAVGMFGLPLTLSFLLNRQKKNQA